MKIEKIEKLAQKGKFEKLISIAEGKDIEMAKAAISALGTIRKDESFNFLVVALRNPNKEIRLAAIEAMGNIGMDRGRTHLRHLADTETDEDIVAAAREAANKLMNAKF
ncbi:MAG: HEAT repeat domain-containing protein [Clostridiales bacterium]|nr:HEAT repeat domain-containing protein [Clostridiales bacterium]